MTLKECYKAIGGDYEGVVSRLVTEARVNKFLTMFLQDASFKVLCDSMEMRDAEEAFRAAHTLKGVCLSLGFTRLGESSHNLTEALRLRTFSEDAETYFKDVRRDYLETVSEIRSMQAETETPPAE